MSDYYVPRVQVEQEFSQIPTFTTTPLAALIMGPNYKLFRYSAASEKAASAVIDASTPANGNLWSGSQTAYTFQQKVSTDVTDLANLEVYLDNAELKYYAPATGTSVALVSGTKNVITAADTLVFKTGYGDDRSVDFKTRDVQVGDIVTLQDTASNPALFETMKVTAILASNTNGTIPSTATRNPSNSEGNANTTIAIGGTFTGVKSITYRIVCTKAGTYAAPAAADKPQVTILSNDIDSAGPITVQGATAYSLANSGLTFTITPGADTALALNDEYKVIIVAPEPDKYNKLVFDKNLPTGGTWNATTFYIKDMRVAVNGLKIPQIPDPAAPTTTWWDATQTGITLKANITGTHPDITEASIPTKLPIAQANVYASRRDLISTYSNAVYNVTGPEQVEAKLGTLHPDNPLAKAVYNAALNAVNTTVYFVAVASNDLTGYNKALELAKKDNKYYGIVPLTYDATIQQAIVAHVKAMSNSKQAKWRVAWISREIEDTITVLNTQANGAPWQAYPVQNPGDGSKYNLVTIGTKNGATVTPDTTVALLTLGVRKGDILRYDYRLDANNQPTFQTTTILEVISQNTFLVEKVWTAAPDVSFKVTIVRAPTSTEKAASYAALASGWNDRRVRLVFPDKYLSGTLTEQGYLLAASLAGLRSGVVPHQSLTNIEVLGPTDLPRVTKEFTEEDLDSIAREGVWIVTQSGTGAPAYTRHQLTTDGANLNYSEDSITANVDSISYGLQKALAPFVGIYNINAGSILKIRAAIDSELSYRMTSTFTERAGTQLLGYEIIKVAQDTTFKDKLLVDVRIRVPYPMNYITITLLV